MSSKGQIVIPAEMRKDIEEGEKLVLIKSNGQLIMKKAKSLRKNFEDDLKFAKKTEEAWKSYDRGEFIEMDFDKFLEEAKKW